jgi:GWxTD domain-containing protein
MKPRRWGLPVVFLMLTLAGCSFGGRSVRSLPEKDKQFLSEVRYIITKKEKKVFQSLGETERAQFVEDFWKKRDPSPSTDENEFRQEYYNRIEQANRLFREGRNNSGWLTDRGRAHILLGPPERRNTYPSGYTFYDRPMEIWYYRYFTLYFVDYTFTGIYKLEPQSAQQIGIITTSQMQLKPEAPDGKRVVFDFGLRVENGASGEVKLVIAVPYATMNMMEKAEQPGTFETTLTIDVQVKGSHEETVLQKKESHPISLQTAALDKLSKNLNILLPLKLQAGKYSVLVTLENSTDNSQVSKKIKFKI